MSNPSLPYYAVIFTSLKSAADEGYAEISARMNALAQQQPGYMGHESYRNENGEGITISYWKDLNSIAQWRNNSEHLQAQRLGKEKWYAHYHIRVCKVERDYEFNH